MIVIVKPGFHLSPLIALACAASLLLCACGQRGPLYLPAQPAPTTPAAAAPTAPATSPAAQ